MTRDLQTMFKKYSYNDACIIGHALEGNLHLIFSQVNFEASPCPILHLHNMRSSRPLAYSRTGLRNPC
jgi:hypothetical protein